MIEATPFGRMLGIDKLPAREGTSLLVLPAGPRLEGRPGFLYGGVIASLIELACVEAVLEEIGTGAVRPKPINMALDFLRGGLLVETFAEASLVRIGKRIVNASALCWQEDRARPIATARMHIALQSRA